MNVTPNNYHIASKGTFVEIPKVPEGFILDFKSTQSQYYISPDKKVLVRKSEHWGNRIKKCDWHLKGYPINDSRDWHEFIGTEPIIGMIKFSDLKDKRHWLKHLSKESV